MHVRLFEEIIIYKKSFIKIILIFLLVIFLLLTFMTNVYSKPLKYEGHGGPVMGLATSIEKNLMASTSFDYSVLLWEFDEIKEVQQLIGHDAAVNVAKFSGSGKLFLNEVNKSGATLLPIDSEHNAIFQVFDFNNSSSVDRLTLTASGGPFIRSSREELLKVTPSQAVKHPNWDMGAKISVDSATMMNKGLELIEAYYLFPVEENQIDILIHPQSVIHSMVSYNDGSVLAQMGTPDMRIPISYALAWPDRLKTPAERLDLSEIGELNFQKPNSKRFPALALARDALKMGGAMPTVLNAANEVAVDCFLNKKIGFLDIMRVIEEVLDETSNSTLHQLSEISSCDYTIRKRAQEIAFELT